MRHEVWIDRGGTFTDCIGFDRETGKLSAVKVRSSDSAALEGIRQLLGVAEGTPPPPCEVRLGTTLATNALLERRGVPCALAITRGFGDLLAIGDQTRPELFALAIERAAPLPGAILEVDARMDSHGAAVLRPDPVRLKDELATLRARGFASLAVVVLNDYARGSLEYEIGALAREVGFSYVCLSSQLSPELGLLARAETAVLDAYLTPLLDARLSELSASLPGSRLRLLQSSGDLTAQARFRGPSALLSGPAGGVVAAARIAERAALGPVIAFDMGGTSTDVTRSAGGELERLWETSIGGLRVRAPTLSVTTVAAGGGSRCRFDGHKLQVGPESAGAVPGPLCYDHPAATELTVTDVNLLLGRLVAERFPFPLAPSRARARLLAIQGEMAEAGYAMGEEALAEGFLEIANRAMADAIREVSVARGHDVREHALLVLGGAGGQHACALARALGVKTVVFHPLAGVLAALGLGLADIGYHGVREAGAELLDAPALERLAPAFAELEAEGRAAVARESSPGDTIELTRSVELRYTGSETTLTLPVSDAGELTASFHARHAELFGHARPEHAVELVCVRVEVVARRPAPSIPPVSEERLAPLTCRTTRLWSRGRWLDQVPIYERRELVAGAELSGPLLLAEATGTLVLDEGFTLSLREDGLLVARAETSELPVPRATGEHPDPILLEVMGRRFMSIAEQMGHVLRRTALSTNIRERLDFSCAVFDGRAELVANAPHIPVHLGAMSETVRAVVERHPDLRAGDVFASNDPELGGSHLPDITVVAPVFDAAGAVRWFVASRGHHADIGGVAPGSMPPRSTRLEQEGIVLSALRIVRAGRLDEERLLSMLASGPHPARRPRDNLADLGAQIASVRTGARLLGELARELGPEAIDRYMEHVQTEAAGRVRDWLRNLGPQTYTFADALDDGTPVRVALHRERDQLVVDFAGTGSTHSGNLNAPSAVARAALLYVVRMLAGTGLPLNAGCLRHVVLRLPEQSLLAPAPGAAVAAGNVETSQRVVDVLLGALGVAAASQGTMNNLCFGDASFGYYETLGGGAGAGAGFAGASAVHTHMTNTRLTDPELLERRYPVRVRELSVRRGSGGPGRFPGGDGLCRELEFLAPLRVSFISERRTLSPFGLAGGGAGARGRNTLNGNELPGSFERDVLPGDRLRIETPGGGGYGTPLD